MTGAAVVGGVLLALIEGVGIVMNRFAASNMQNGMYHRSQWIHHCSRFHRIISKCNIHFSQYSFRSKSCDQFTVKKCITFCSNDNEL